MAQALGLKVNTDVRDCGKFSVPGSEAVHSYAGVIDGHTVLELGDGLRAAVSNMRVIAHPQPFILLGDDVLSGGRTTGWNFTGLQVRTVGPGKVEASMSF